MELKAVLFDLDGTLLPMDQDVFIRSYFKLLAARMAPRGYEPKKFIDSIWAGTAAMVKNDGGRTNEEAFWQVFCGIQGEDSLRDREFIDGFYTEEFHQVREVCGFAPGARETVDLLKAAGVTVVLATNPIFPAVATRSRLRWAGLSAEDFAYVTSYENCRYSKPNPAYYAEILENTGLCAEACLMVGNDAAEDTAAAQLGMRVFLLTDCLINKKGADISGFPQGGFDELKAYLSELVG